MTLACDSGLILVSTSLGSLPGTRTPAFARARTPVCVCACVVARAQYVTSARFTFGCGLGRGFGWNYGNIAAATDKLRRGVIVPRISASAGYWA